MSRIDVVLRSARRRFRRLPAAEVPDAVRRGAVLVDIRPQAQRFREGEVPGALVIERNVLEWRCDIAMSRIDVVLRSARRRFRRLPAAEVPDAVRRGAVLVDIRPQAQRFREGEVPGALVIERNVLEWRCDPTSDARLPEAVGDDVEWVILCSEGYTSSLAAAALLDIGLHRATLRGHRRWNAAPGAHRADRQTRR